jgi:hypothetical protein
VGDVLFPALVRQPGSWRKKLKTIVHICIDSLAIEDEQRWKASVCIPAANS